MMHLRCPDCTSSTFESEKTTILAHYTTPEGGAYPDDIEPCMMAVGTRCNHGYRLDATDGRKDGDGCRVVAIDDVRKHDRWGATPIALRGELLALSMGDEVTVLLDDGRVVLTTVTGSPRNLGDAKRPTFLVWLDHFSGGFSLERVRPKDWRWWARMLPPPPKPPE